MALNETFDAKKLWDQARAVGLGKKLSEFDAEDFASSVLEMVLKYQHYRPMEWSWSLYFRTWAKNDKNTISIDAPISGTDDFTLKDTLVAEPTEVPVEEFSPSDDFYKLLASAPSAWGRERFIRKSHLWTVQFKEYIDSLEPIEIDWIQF